MQTQAKTLTIMDVIFPKVTLIRDVLLILSLAVVTALCAKMSFTIKVGLVPITGQTFAVLLTGALLGSRRGAMSMLTYVGIGAAGMPFWFATTTLPGVAGLMGPTGGYIIGFIPAAFAVGLLVERGWDRRFWSMAIALLVGLSFIYVFGLSWLAHFVPDGALLSSGFYPFLPGEAVKLALLAGALPAGWALLKHLGK